MSRVMSLVRSLMPMVALLLAIHYGIVRGEYDQALFWLMLIAISYLMNIDTSIKENQNGKS